MAEDFTWRDGERTIRFGTGVAVDGGDLLEQGGFEGFAHDRARRRGSAGPRRPGTVDGARACRKG
jgi:hypothetical protein